MVGAVDVGGEQLAEITSPVGGQQPGCSKRNGFSYSFGFPKGQSSVDGIDRVRTLRFSKVVGKASNEIASPCTPHPESHPTFPALQSTLYTPHSALNSPLRMPQVAMAR